MRSFLLGSAVVASMIASAPAFAASAETDAFVANIRLNAAFLSAASTLAADRSGSAGLQAFASKEAADEQAVVDTLDRRSLPAVAQTVPMNVASNELVTGRSAAVDDTDADASRFTQPAGTGALMPAAMITLEHLAATKGDAFDSLYKATQVNALRQLSAFYNAYAMTGDDAALRQMAKDELTATDARIADLGRL